MKVGLISFFLLFAPFTAARISDGFSIGLLDLMSFAFLALALPRISSVAKTGLGFLLTLLICTLTFSFLAGSIVNEFSARDLAFARMIFIMLPAILLISQPMSEEKVWRMTFLFFWEASLRSSWGSCSIIWGFKSEAISKPFGPGMVQVRA